MKTYVPILLVALSFTACKKGGVAPYQSQGVITGYLIPPCYYNTGPCGGIEITIKDDPTKNPPPFYFVDTTLTQLGISDNTKLPKNVSLDWKHDPTTNNYLIVTSLKVD